MKSFTPCCGLTAKGTSESFWWQQIAAKFGHLDMVKKPAQFMTERDAINWTLKETEIFKTIKRALASALAFQIPEGIHSCLVDERQHVASGLLSQTVEHGRNWSTA